MGATLTRLLLLLASAALLGARAAGVGLIVEV